MGSTEEGDWTDLAQGSPHERPEPATLPDPIKTIFAPQFLDFDCTPDILVRKLMNVGRLETQLLLPSLAPVNDGMAERYDSLSLPGNVVLGPLALAGQFRVFP